MFEIINTMKNLTNYKDFLKVQDKELPGIVFDYYDFNLFYKRKKEPEFFIKSTRRISKKLLEILCFIHQIGIIHCDLTPPNIFFSINKKKKNVHATVGDFSNSIKKSKILDFINREVTTEIYRSPEKIILLKKYNGKDIKKMNKKMKKVLSKMFDERIDVYALGCTIFYMYTGIEIFRQYKKESSRKEYKKILEENIKDNPLLLDLLTKMLTYNKDERPFCKECLNHEYFTNLSNYRHKRKRDTKNEIDEKYIKKRRKKEK